MFGWLFGWLWEKSVRGDVVLITGGAMGIGRLLALKFAALGATVVIWDLHEDLGAQVVAEVEALPTKDAATDTGRKRAYFFRVDVTDRETVYATGAEVTALLGGVDILINNAGIVGGRPILESSDRMIERTMAVNATSHFWTIKAFLPGMLERNKGHIVSLASAAGIFGSPGMVDYGASKFAAVGLMASLRQELHAMGRPNIQTTVICPSFIDTGMFEGVTTPMFTTLLSPEYVASSIVRAVRRNHYQLLLPSVLVLLDLIAKIAPTWFLDLYMRVTKSNRTMHTFKQNRVHTIKEEKQA